MQYTGSRALVAARGVGRGGAVATATMQPWWTRAAYTGDGGAGIPDGRAIAVSSWLRALTAVIT
jgi:subtilase family serine protease